MNEINMDNNSVSIDFNNPNQQNYQEQNRSIDRESDYQKHFTLAPISIENVPFVSSIGCINQSPCEQAINLNGLPYNTYINPFERINENEQNHFNNIKNINENNFENSRMNNNSLNDSIDLFQSNKFNQNTNPEIEIKPTKAISSIQSQTQNSIKNINNTISVSGLMPINKSLKNKTKQSKIDKSKFQYQKYNNEINAQQPTTATTFSKDSNNINNNNNNILFAFQGESGVNNNNNIFLYPSKNESSGLDDNHSYASSEAKNCINSDILKAINTSECDISISSIHTLGINKF
jgi:hypothetical protein